jgi:hypothetical protein
LLRLRLRWLRRLLRWLRRLLRRGGCLLRRGGRWRWLGSLRALRGLRCLRWLRLAPDWLLRWLGRRRARRGRGRRPRRREMGGDGCRRPLLWLEKPRQLLRLEWLQGLRPVLWQGELLRSRRLTSGRPIGWDGCATVRAEPCGQRRWS